MGYKQDIPWWNSNQILNVWDLRINQGYARFIRRADGHSDDGVVDVLFHNFGAH